MINYSTRKWKASTEKRINIFWKAKSIKEEKSHMNLCKTKSMMSNKTWWPKMMMNQTSKKTKIKSKWL
jgi:hypothetical protein